MDKKDTEPDPACIFCALDHSDGEAWEIRACYFAIGMATAGARMPSETPIPCERHMSSIALGCALLGRVCGAPQAEIADYESRTRKTLQ